MTDLLLDTQVLLWILDDPSRLSVKAAKALAEAEGRLHVSAASLWELAIKSGLGKVELPGGVEGLAKDLAASGVHELPVRWHHTKAVASLPLHHRDPFDRLLVAQAQAEDLALVSADKALRAYKVRLIW